MKKIFLIFVIFLCNVCLSFAQTQATSWVLTTNVKTPCGATVPDTYIITAPNFSSGEIAQWKTDVLNYGAQYLDDPTWTYNCHAWAWHMSEGGTPSPVWIGWTSSTAHNAYWHSTTGGYVAVAESSATKVDYPAMCNHSAVRESQYVYVSKWGPGPRVRHAPYALPPQFNPQTYILLGLNPGNFGYYARPSYTVSFNMNGASGSIPSQSVQKCGTATKPSPDPVWSGYTFGGWYKESSCINLYDFTTSVTSNLTLYAKWIPPASSLPIVGHASSIIYNQSNEMPFQNAEFNLKIEVMTDAQSWSTLYNKTISLPRYATNVTMFSPSAPSITVYGSSLTGIRVTATKPKDPQSPYNEYVVSSFTITARNGSSSGSLLSNNNAQVYYNSATTIFSGSTSIPQGGMTIYFDMNIIPI